MSDEVKSMVESGLKSVGEKLDQAITKFEGQLAEKGKVDTEVKSEVKELSEQFKSLAASVTDLSQKQEAGIKHEDEKLSAGAEFIKSEGFKQFQTGQREKVRMEVKNTVTAISGTTTFPQQNQALILPPFKPLSIRDLLPSVPVSTNMVNSLRELSWTNDAAEVSQGAAKPESDLTFEAYNVPITTVAHWIKVSKQLMEDAPAVMARIDGRLRDGLAQRIDLQLLNGNGTSPNISGITDSGNFTAYTSTSTDNLVDAINKAKYLLWANGYTPDAVIVNPADWGALERTKLTDGAYMYGAPGVAAGMNPFGLRIVLSTNMAAGYFAVGAFNRSTTVYNRTGAVVEMGYVGSDFTNNLVTIRAEERLGLGVELPGGIMYGQFDA
ncbi:phage major capsid protein [Variovorax sp. RT4R15]|uniref:phage major capsid protein n=1 Tax=Variovorax sp. RT4R15 TaxID=3443737 RepID=UPI003F47834E